MRARSVWPRVSVHESADSGGERSGTLVRGLSILESLIASTQSMTLGEIAQAVSLDQSTVHRLLRTLQDAGYVLRSGEMRRYSASPKFLQPLALLHPLNLVRREIAPVVAELAQRISKTVVMVLFVGGERLVVEIAQAPGSLNPYYGSWLHGPLHASCGGKALLLSLDDEQRDELLGSRSLEACTPQTITDLKRLNEDLEHARRRGYVMSREEHRSGVTNVGVNIRSWNGRTVACLIASGYAHEMSEAICAQIGVELKQAAEMAVYRVPSLEMASRLCA